MKSIQALAKILRHLHTNYVELSDFQPGDSEIEFKSGFRTINIKFEVKAAGEIGYIQFKYFQFDTPTLCFIDEWYIAGMFRILFYRHHYEVLAEYNKSNPSREEIEAARKLKEIAKNHNQSLKYQFV
jgi:hypothetical protein